MTDVVERPENCALRVLAHASRKRWRLRSLGPAADEPARDRGALAADASGRWLRRWDRRARFRCAYRADCLHWRRPPHGLHPVNRGDMPMTWWARAGHCTRHAPRPVRDPGPRGFWPATLDVDFCAEGAPRVRAPET